jgi:demethylmenaquinone methyltransferase/2-methoxy-6-polyprenyl-1,4-benzoquinol methylase
MNKTCTSGLQDQEMEIPAQTGKKEMVRQMFDSIARRYDFLNHFLSLGIDRIWRKKAMQIIRRLPHKAILDVATGTGDMSILASRLNTTTIVGIDISSEMLEIQKKKLESKKLNEKITLQVADAENLPFEKESFDVIMTAFGVRNFENLDKGLSEFYRVLKYGGHVVILEFSKPTTFFVKGIFKFYFSNILPMLGRMVSKHNFAYSYLPDSVDRFPSGAEFSQRLRKAGFVETNYKSLSFGIASIYTGKK